MSCEEKLSRLQRLLVAWGEVGLAFSGGVDSSLLLHLAFAALGPERVWLLHARSNVQRRADQERMVQWQTQHPQAAQRLRIVEFQPLAWPDFVLNPPNRCYICKRKIYTTFLEILSQKGLALLMDGSQGDDLQEGEAGRPGLRALAELGVQSPLADCGFTKEEIRHLSRELGLPTWNLPSSSCLATRIPTGMEIKAERLAVVDRLEQTVRNLGLSDCRIRPLLGTEAHYSLQLTKEELASLQPAGQQQLCQGLKDRGATKILLDLDGR
jgi:uncharacterized protein